MKDNTKERWNKMNLTVEYLCPHSKQFGGSEDFTECICSCWKHTKPKLVIAKPCPIAKDNEDVEFCEGCGRECGNSFKMVEDALLCIGCYEEAKEASRQSQANPTEGSK